MAIPKLIERIRNAATRLSINPDYIEGVIDLSSARRYYDAFHEYECKNGLNRCLMINYSKYVFHTRHCFVCDNGFVVEYEEHELESLFPNHYNIYNIMALYSMGYTQKDIAKALNTSTSTIGNRIKIIKQILKIASIYDIDPEDVIKIEYDGVYTHLRLSDLSNRLQAIIDKYERRKNDGENEYND